jgi:hypothetical protein
MLCAAFLLGARCIMIPYRWLARSSTLPLAGPGDQRFILSVLPVR